MPFHTILWGEKRRNNASYFGKNGVGKCCGIEIAHVGGKFVSLQPINSKDFVSDSALIQIPIAEVGNVCSMIQKDLLDLVLTNLKDQLPRLLGMDPTLDGLIASKLKEL